jgi:hypothetical protein
VGPAERRLIDLGDCVPEDKMAGSPLEDLWSYRHILARLTVHW